MSKLSKVNVCNKENKKKELIYNARERMINILSYVDFAKLCHKINYFPQSNQNFGEKTLTSLSHQFQEPLNYKNKIVMNLNQVCLLLIQERNMTPQLIKIFLWRLYFYNSKIN